MSTVCPTLCDWESASWRVQILGRWVLSSSFLVFFLKVYRLYCMFSRVRLGQCHLAGSDTREMDPRGGC